MSRRQDLVEESMKSAAEKSATMRAVSGPARTARPALVLLDRERCAERSPTWLLVEDLVRLAVDALLILLGQVAGLLRLSGA